MSPLLPSRQCLSNARRRLEGFSTQLELVKHRRRLTDIDIPERVEEARRMQLKPGALSASVSVAWWGRRHERNQPTDQRTNSQTDRPRGLATLRTRVDKTWVPDELSLSCLGSSGALFSRV